MCNKEGKVIAGKDEYLSPEQVSYATTDACATLFPLGLVLTALFLGKNIFRSPDRVDSHLNILTLPIPRFAMLRAAIDDKLATMLQRLFQRDRDRCYQSAAAVFDDLEHHLCSDGYGPTNEKTGVYLRDLMNCASAGSRPPGAL